MQKRTYVLILLALILGCLYIYKFTDSFKKRQIQIKYRNLAGRGGTVTFYLDGEYALTSVKVISVAEAATNKYPHSYWQLESKSNSLPQTDFLYGQPIPGMTPKIPGVAPDLLAPTEEYQITVEAGKLKGEKNFRLVEKN